MSANRSRWKYVLPLGLLALCGCNSWCRRQVCNSSPGSALVWTSPSAGRSSFNPPASSFLPTTPELPAQAAPPILGEPVPGSMPPNSPELRWGPPRTPGATLLPPEPLPAEKPREAAAQPFPESPEPPVAPRPKVEERREPQPPPTPTPTPPVPKEDDRTPTPVLPEGIVGFASVREGISTGRRPFPEGLDWLKERGYRAALYLFAPGENDVTDRRELETKRGLKYHGLELSPEKMTQEIVERFNKLVADTAQQPLFVYDRDGMLVGGLWYLHLRIVERLPDPAARRKAAEFGLKEDENGPHRDMWLAIQRYLRDYPIP